MTNMAYTTAKGFSIGEVLLSIFILSIGVVSAVKLTQGNVLQSMESRDSIIASQLAQEGVELVRNARDNNAAQRYFDKQQRPSQPHTWQDIFQGFGNCSGKNIQYNNFHDLSGLRCVNGEFLERISGLYVPTATTQKFKRQVILTPDAHPATAYTVTSFVVWDDNYSLPTDKNNCTLAQKCVFAENILTSWIAVEN